MRKPHGRLQGGEYRCLETYINKMDILHLKAAFLGVFSGLAAVVM